MKGHDISTMYTKHKNKRCGRNGYCNAKTEKENTISPRDYGMFIKK